MAPFVHLHVHSNYSLMEGFVDPSQLIHAAQTHGMSALALTDHLNLSGAIEFYLGCLKANIQPILGLEINLVLPRRFASSSRNVSQGALVLLATSTEGWANLCRLTASILNSADADSASPCSLGLLSNHTAGLICLSGGRRSLVYHLIRSGELPAASAFMKEIAQLFPGRFYAEIQIHAEEDQQTARQLSILAREERIPQVITQDIYYLEPSQEEAQNTLCAIRLNRTLTELKPIDCLSPQAYWISPEDIESRFRDFPEAIANSQKIAASCRFDLPVGTPHFPIIPLPAGITAAAALRQKAIAGAVRLYGALNPEIETRLDHELKVITALGFEPIFLIMEEILRWARQAGVPFSSRGSAASSLVAHCLGITNPDPLHLNLYFERFLNPARSSPPDIDTDLCSRRRDQVLQHVFSTYGKDRVAMVGTINRFRPRSALGDVAKAHGFAPVEVRQMVAALPYHYFYRGETEDEEETPVSPFQGLEFQFSSPRHRAVFKQAAAILGLPRHLSVHAGGVVITPGPLTDLLPIQQANKGITITQLDHKALRTTGYHQAGFAGDPRD